MLRSLLLAVLAGALLPACAERGSTHGDAGLPLDAGLPGDAASRCPAPDADVTIDAGASDAGDESDAGEPMDGGALETYVGPFTACGDRFRVWTGDRYRGLFVRAVNLGAALPGDGPNDLSASKETYLHWFDAMREGGVNAVRVYVLQFPRFYEALAEHNRAHPEAPLYLVQGVWLPETSEGGSLDLLGLTAAFERNLDDALDAIHGQKELASRPSGAWGSYAEDVSAWTLAWLPGREVLATEVRATDRAHPGRATWEGERLRIAESSASERWMTQRLDHLLDREMNAYGSGRPIAFSNWLELDPIHHPTEGADSGKDVAQVDLGLVEPYRAPAGYFVSYHVYPYYPNFVSEDPGYLTRFDELGPNSYRGILDDLIAHHAGTPLFVAEFGLPSSWGRAHSSASGMHHGGHDEDAQGRYAARMIRSIHDAGAAGGAYFQWTDGWWKRIWITNALTFPSERLRLWHDLANAQQSYGLLAFQLPEPDFAAASPNPGAGHVEDVRAAFDAEFVHLRVTLDQPIADGEALVVGFDTYADDRGETLLPDGTQSTRRHELALVVTAPDHAELRVLRAYDLFSIRERTPQPGALFRSVASDVGDWVAPLWRIAAAHGSDDGAYTFPAEDYPIGVLRARRGDAPATSMDAVVIEGATLRIRIPWTYLQFTDPTRRQVMDDDLATSAREVAVTPGIAFAVAYGGSLVETPRIGWPTWSVVPTTEERMKTGAEVFFEQLREYAGWMD